jgi:hypothetical protein
MADHTPQFAAARDVVLELEDADRRALARLFGAMHAPEADPSLALIAALRTIAALPDADVVKLARWFRRYVSRWGQVPIAASRSVKSGADR